MCHKNPLIKFKDERSLFDYSYASGFVGCLTRMKLASHTGEIANALRCIKNPNLMLM